MNTPTPPKRPHGPLYYIQHVIGAAIVVATLFTAWTRVDLLPLSLSEKLASALASRGQETQDAVLWPTPKPRSPLRVGIVSGHWGNDSGAVCDNGVREVDVNQEVATLVSSSLEGEGYEVDLLKEFDPRLQGYQAAVLVSIHADSCMYVNDQATGFKVAAAMSTTYPEKAARLTSCMRTRYAETTSLPFHPGSVTADMSSYHAFDETDENTTAAIIEIGFLNLDFNILTEQPELIARGITRGILCYLQNEDVTSEETPVP
ncbi:MAG: N-acetylmuramoyl-L-alanine amidase [Chloroflexi bacterium]|nr:MAG: N-acetylmuramoyl-L-alanine amidase [Chloroflexota bacterium]